MKFIRVVLAAIPAHMLTTVFVLWVQRPDSLPTDGALWLCGGTAASLITFASTLLGDRS